MRGPRYDDARPTAAQRGYDRIHKRWRRRIIARDPVCRRCARAASTEADHIVPLEDGGTWDDDNGQGMCKPCHTKKTREDIARRRRRA